MQEFSKKDFTEKLKTARKQKYRTQNEFSKILGIKRVTYARYELNNFPPLPLLYKISKLLDVSVDYLLEPKANELTENDKNDTL